MLQNIPKNIWLEILTYLDLNSISKYRQTCKKNLNIGTDNYIWNYRLNLDFNYKNPRFDKNEAYSIYKKIYKGEIILINNNSIENKESKLIDNDPIDGIIIHSVNSNYSNINMQFLYLNICSQIPRSGKLNVESERIYIVLERFVKSIDSGTIIFRSYYKIHNKNVIGLTMIHNFCMNLNLFPSTYEQISDCYDLFYIPPKLNNDIRNVISKYDIYDSNNFDQINNYLDTIKNDIFPIFECHKTQLK